MASLGGTALQEGGDNNMTKCLNSQISATEDELKVTTPFYSLSMMKCLKVVQEH